METRLASLRQSGFQGSPTFPTSIMMATSDRADGVWAVSGLRPELASIFRIDSELAVTSDYKIQIPADSLIKDRPPILLAAWKSRVALGFREGAVALAENLGTNV